MEFKGVTLDRFQEEAVQILDGGHSVLVAAPTGSGKTLIAEYVISKEFNSGQKIVYTAPIKALSNQKYHDFCEDYGKDKVGLITGDIVINPEADILVMTTEVYRNMAVSRDPVVNEVSYVVFDEVHYISDIERGTTWEEAIIFAPAHTRFVCLSATVPNADEMAAWIAKIKNHKVEVVHYDKRPVPLKQMWFDTELGLCEMDALQSVIDIPSYEHVTGRHRKRRPQIRNPFHEDLVAELSEKDLLPCIFFVFSRADCEKKAMELAKRMSFGTVSAPWESLSPELRALKTTTNLRSVVSKGIAYHHAGMLPGVKHIVERLFAEGKIKVLYATETFAVGVNMPARTVAMDSLRKYDGISMRNMNTREYAQMSGRAGRRGIDEEGTAVVMVFRNTFDVQSAKRITGKDELAVKSQFRLSVNTTLNLLKRHPPEEIPDILAKTFWSYQEKKGKAVIERRFTNLLKQLREAGYVKEHTLTEKGEFAAKVYTDEMLLAEVFAQGTGLSEYQVLLLFAAMVYEARRGDAFKKYKGDEESHELRARLSDIDRNDERWRNIGKLVALVRPCYDGVKFGQLIANSSLAEGDLAKLFTQMIDRVRQVRKATRRKDVKEKMDRCLAIIQGCLEGIDII